MDKIDTKLDYARSMPGESRPRVSIFAIVVCVIAVITLPCGMIQLCIPASTFNSVDLKYRAIFWTDVSGIPALIALMLNAFAAYRIKSMRLGGMAWAFAGISISAVWVIGALLGLGVFGIDP